MFLIVARTAFWAMKLRRAVQRFRNENSHIRIEGNLLAEDLIAIFGDLYVGG